MTIDRARQHAGEAVMQVKLPALLVALLALTGSAALLADTRLEWDPVDDPRLTGYEVYVAPRAEQYSPVPTWAGEATGTGALELTADTWYKAYARSVGEIGEEVIYSQPSNELQWLERERKTIIILQAPLSIQLQAQ